jgi:hypothetical protein
MSDNENVSPNFAQNGRKRAWCFTINNYEDTDVVRLSELVQNEYARYVCFQPEIGASGTRHVQGYVVFANAKQLSGVKRRISRRCHAEPAKGTAQQNREYCSKADTLDTSATCGGEPFVFREYGEFPAGTGCGKGMLIYINMCCRT